MPPRQAHVTGRVRRIFFIEPKRFLISPISQAQITFEVLLPEPRYSKTFIAFGRNAMLMHGFLQEGKMFSIDYWPYDTERDELGDDDDGYDGEAISANSAAADR